jgi:hypothetical protein
MKHVVSISGGISSFITALWVLQNKPKQDVVLLFADTKVESPDLYRFLRDAEKFLDHAIIRLTDGRTPLQLATEQGFIYNSRIANCTSILKIRPIKTYIKDLKAQGHDVTLYLGMDERDKGRLAAPIANWAKIGVSVSYPLIENNIAPRQKIQELAITPPDSYRLGFPNNNCLEQGCVKAGISTWLNLLIKKPDVFWQTAHWENAMRDKVGDYAILSRERNGIKSIYTLYQLAQEYEDAQERARLAPVQLALFVLDADMDSICQVECGIGSIDESEE